ncbi:DMT family transporter [Kocuria sp. M1R5S2]|uniref:DMT family transporter n=1 Tax=Kocuria rhizosphaerae TaxID=3376285 RepID=UPI0037B984A6
MPVERPPAGSCRDERSRAWGLLVLSGVLEAVWATALGASAGLGRPGPTALFAVTLVLSMLTLARAARVVPMGTAYAVWTGIGAVLTVAWAVGTGQQVLSWLQAVFLAGIVACVVGLNAAEHRGAAQHRVVGERRSVEEPP